MVIRMMKVALLALVVALAYCPPSLQANPIVYLDTLQSGVPVTGIQTQPNGEFLSNRGLPPRFRSVCSAFWGRSGPTESPWSIRRSTRHLYRPLHWGLHGRSDKLYLQ